MSVSPFVSLTMKRQKRNPTNEKAEKYQIDPYTYSELFIMNSKVRVIMVKWIDLAVIARPAPASTHTSGM